MREFQITYTHNGAPPQTVMFYAHDRVDAIKLIQRTYRGAKVTSARMTKLTRPVPPTPADPCLDGMLDVARGQVKANAHSGKAIGKYLRVLLAVANSDTEIRRACEWIVRQVEDRTAGVKT